MKINTDYLQTNPHKSYEWIFQFDFVCPLQPIKFGGDGADFDVSSYLGNVSAAKLQGTLCVSTFSRSCREPCVFLPFIIIIIIPLSSAMGCLWQPIEPYVKKL